MLGKWMVILAGVGLLTVSVVGFCLGVVIHVLRIAQAEEASEEDH